jgi:hypothetical protein
MMSTSPYERLFKTDCPYCLLRREIIAVNFHSLDLPRPFSSVRLVARPSLPATDPPPNAIDCGTVGTIHL